VRQKLELGSDYHESDNEGDDQKELGSDIPKGEDEMAADEDDFDDDDNDEDEEYYSEEGGEKDKRDQEKFELSPRFVLENGGENVFNPLMYFASLLKEIRSMKESHHDDGEKPPEIDK
jgi:hypothetical protein